jgi:glycosyltransferase involved in cell wall biosynthesis
MMIGIDGGALAVRDPRLKVGVYKITERLSENISQIEYSNYYRIYTFNKIGEGGLFVKKRVEFRVPGPALGWQKIWLSLELTIHPVQVFLGLSQFIPFVPFKSTSSNIGFIYDLGFIHAPDLYPGSYNDLVKQTKSLISRSNRIVTISNFVKIDIINTYKYPANLIDVCYPGVDKIFTPKGNIFKSKPYFLSVGALKPGKNISQLVKIFDKFITDSKQDYELLIIGGNYWYDKKIDEALSTVRNKDKIKLLGVVPDSQLPSYYRGATATIITSLTEGFCLPVVESMACGCPVVAAHAGALPEIVGGAGIIVPAGDLAGFVSALSNLTDMRRRKIYSDKGLEIVKKYSWEKFTKGVLESINKATHNKK